jgi:transaldolase
MVARLAQSYAGEAEHPRILAASVKSDEEAIDALSQGADAVSVPIDVLTSLAEHELSRSAIAGFVEDAATLLSTGDDEG